MQLGIDIGTCYSKATLLLDNGAIQFIGQNNGIPSSIYVDPHNTFVFGQDSENRQLIDPRRYQSAFKSNLGSRDKRTYLLRISPDELLSRMIWRIKKEAEHIAGGPLPAAVITVPPSFNEGKRDLMKKAAAKAGFSEVKIFAEAPAAAMYHHWRIGNTDHSDSKKVLIYDLGGTFNAALVWREENTYRYIRPTVQTLACAGLAFDQAIYDDFRRVKGSDNHSIRNLLDPQNQSLEALQAQSYIRLLCRNLKHQLSSSLQAQLVADTYAFQNAPTTYVLTRDQLEQMLKPLLMQTIQYCHALVHQAQIKWENVSQVLLVGGCSRIPYVKSLLAQGLQRPVAEVYDLDLAICQGAALYAEQRSKHTIDPVAKVMDLIDIIKNLRLGDNRKQIVALMTYEEAIEYFVKARPASPHIQKGAMLRQSHPQGQLFIQVFLDKQNKVASASNGTPYGRMLVARQFDTELNDIFGDKELVVVE